MEKVVASLEHIVPLSSLLTRSATGQSITTYFNLIYGPAPRWRTRWSARNASGAAR
jgi:L-lactate utilization protein LutB